MNKDATKKALVIPDAHRLNAFQDASSTMRNDAVLPDKICTGCARRYDANSSDLRTGPTEGPCFFDESGTLRRHVCTGVTP